jgi:hypothetical protein
MILGATDQNLWMFEVLKRSLGRVGKRRPAAGGRPLVTGWPRVNAWPCLDLFLIF